MNTAVIADLFKQLRETTNEAEQFHDAGLAYESSLALGVANELILTIAEEVQR